MRDPDEPIDPEIVDPGPKEEPPRDAPTGRSFFEPTSGLVILGVDWVAFGVELPASFLVLPALLVCAAAFAAAFWAVFRIQSRVGDPPGKARLKALLGGLAAGAPFPVTGTIVGTAILVLSGLNLGKKRPDLPSC